MPLGCRSLEGSQGSFSWQETILYVQNTLERLYRSSGSRLPQDSHGGAGKCCWGEWEERLQLSPQFNVLQKHLSLTFFLFLYFSFIFSVSSILNSHVHKVSCKCSHLCFPSQCLTMMSVFVQILRKSFHLLMLPQIPCKRLTDGFMGIYYIQWRCWVITCNHGAIYHINTQLFPSSMTWFLFYLCLLFPFRSVWRLIMSSLFTYWQNSFTVFTI